MDLASEFLFDVTADLAPPQQIGAARYGTRRIIYVQHGTFAGPRMRGEVLPGGGDWFLIRADGVMETDARVTLRTDDGHLIYLQHRGVFNASPPILERLQSGDRDIAPADYYFRVALIFETGSATYGWLNSILAVGVGRRTPTGVAYSVHAIK